MTSPGPRMAGDGRREANAATVLRTVLGHGPVARSGIARLSGLSPAAVSRQCTDRSSAWCRSRASASASTASRRCPGRCTSATAASGTRGDSGP